MPRPSTRRSSRSTRPTPPVYGALNLKVLADYLTWGEGGGILELSDDPSKFVTDRFLPSA